ncbi:MAG: DHHW family protein [Firmicutes bacterium]|nr:DHHW family protein [Bacillota bacterium]
MKLNKDNAGHAFAAVSFFAALVIVGALSVSLAKPSFSALENRDLEPAPHFSVRALFFEHLPDKISSWYSDTFPAREKLVGAASSIRDIRGVSGDSVHFGVGSLQDFEEEEEETTEPDGVPAVAEPAEEVTEPEVPDQEGEVKKGLLVLGDTALEMYGFSSKSMIRYATLVNRFASTYGITTSVLVTPTHIAFKLPARYKSMSNDQKEALEFLGGQLDPGINNVWVYDTMAKHSKEYTYFRTDHHWTGLGAYYAYVEFCKSRGFPCAPIESYETFEHYPFLGSFYRSVGGDGKMKSNPDTLTVYRVNVPYVMYCYPKGPDGQELEITLSQLPEALANSEEKYMAFAGGDTPYAKIITENHTGRKLLLVRESFAAAFTPFLAENYDEIHIVDFRYYKNDVGKLVREAGITEALFLNYISAAGSSVQMDRMEKCFGWRG